VASLAGNYNKKFSYFTAVFTEIVFLLCFNNINYFDLFLFYQDRFPLLQ